MLLNVLASGKIDPRQLITHRFTLEKILDAYGDRNAASTHAGAKVIALQHHDR